MLNGQNITSLTELRALVGTQVIYQGDNTLLIDVLELRVRKNVVHFRGRTVKFLLLRNEGDTIFTKKVVLNPEFEFKAPISKVGGEHLSLLENNLVWRGNCSFTLWNLPEYLDDLKRAELALEKEKNRREWKLKKFGCG
jgi:hypothetical protein